MKSEPKNFLRRILEAVLVLLGFSVCGGCRVEYGCPHVTFQVKGTVTDETGVPIKGIKVVISGSEDVYTDENGEFVGAHTDAPALDWCRVSFEDVDGEDNGGLFKSATLGIDEMTTKQLEKGNSHWDSGDFEITADVKLEKEIAD